jgi:signal transduction histidine kinase
MHQEVGPYGIIQKHMAASMCTCEEMILPPTEQQNFWDAPLFTEEAAQQNAGGQNLRSGTWCVLLVDDDEEVHAATRLALRGVHFLQKDLELVSVYSGEQGRQVFMARNDIALAIVDVVMETEQAGLELVHYVRNTLNNHHTRLVLRTGHAGQAPQDKVIREYEIDDYKEKSEMTQRKLHTLLYSKLRAYHALCLLDEQRSGLEQVVQQRTAQLAEANQALRKDVARRELAEQALMVRNTELNALNAKLTIAQESLIQSEKMASIGQLAAGVAHEINNPIGYIFSNFGTLETYLTDLFKMLEAYEQAERAGFDTRLLPQLAALKQSLELEFLKEDIPTLMGESKEGIGRVRKIVQDLKDFSHVDASTDWQYTNLNRGIDSTLNVVNSEIRYKADVVKDYGDLPQVQCMPSQINQVVMNLVVNAAHAIGSERGRITIRTGVEGGNAWFSVTDTGSGIPKEVLPRIFDPFYTTKPVGKGTGLGLSLSYGIIQKHHGSIDVQTELGKGTTFRVTVPLSQAADAADVPEGSL